MRAPIGTKIRNRRKVLGLSQAHLAREVDISPSYLNLIEGSKRDVGGALLIRIATRLGVDIDAFTGQKEQRLLHDLGELLADPIVAGLDIRRPSRANWSRNFPRWRLRSAGSIARISTPMPTPRPMPPAALRSAAVETAAAPGLSQVTAMRSSAEILKARRTSAPTRRTASRIDRSRAHAMTDWRER